MPPRGLPLLEGYANKTAVCRRAVAVAAAERLSSWRGQQRVSASRTAGTRAGRKGTHLVLRGPEGVRGALDLRVQPCMQPRILGAHGAELAADAREAACVHGVRGDLRGAGQRGAASSGWAAYAELGERVVEHSRGVREAALVPSVRERAAQEPACHLGAYCPRKGLHGAGHGGN